MNDGLRPTKRIIGPRGAIPARSAPLLVGREAERALLRDELSSAIAGHGRLVLLGGEAGIGKTSLVRELANESESAGIRVISGHCYDLTNTPPYGPWLEIFHRLRPDQTMPAAPEPFAGGQLGKVPDQSALFAEVHRYLIELCELSPVLLLLEDLHWSDPASIELLRHLAPFIIQRSLLVVVTYRDDELTRRHPLFQALPALVREGDGVRLEPRPLDTTALQELVRAHYRLLASDESRLVSYLERHSEGNPFFGVELLRALEEEGLLRVGDDRSTLGELERVVVPSLLRQVIEGRVMRLGEESRRPVEIASVVGQNVPIELWQALTAMNDDTLHASIERLIDANLVVVNRTGTHFRFIHALTREAIYTGILQTRRRILHCRTAELLMQNTYADVDTVASHFVQAGEPRAVDWLVRAGDRAQRAYAWITAAERLQQAASLLENVAGQEEKYTWLTFRASHLLRFSNTSESIASLNQVYSLASRSGDAVLEAEVQSDARSSSLLRR